MITDLLLNVKLPFDTRRRRARSEGVIHRLTALMAHVNLLYLSEHPETPLLYESGVRYMLPDQVRAPRINPAKLKDLVKFLRSAEASHETIVTVLRFLVGMESFCDIPMLLERGGGDCNQLSPWRLAELWRADVRAQPFLTSARNSRGGTSYHALVLWPDNTSEDPSRLLGMGGDQARAERLLEQRKNEERQANLVDAASVLALAQGMPSSVVGEIVQPYGLVPRRGWPC